MIAALIAIDLQTGVTNVQLFDETTDDPGGPVRAARGLQYGIEKDWPGWHWTIVADTEARKVWCDYRTGRICGDYSAAPRETTEGG